MASGVKLTPLIEIEIEVQQKERPKYRKFYREISILTNRSREYGEALGGQSQSLFRMSSYLS